MFIDGRPLTNEQLAALGSGARKMKVQAFAGTGKTTLLRALAEQSHKAKGLYLAFNASIAREAASIFPMSVRCQTHNAMALRALGARDASWRNLRSGKLDQVGREHLATLPGQDGLDLVAVLATLSSFIQSDRKEIGLEDFPLIEATFAGNGKLGVDPLHCVAFARQAWERMADPTSEIPMPHDGYLKLWSLGASEMPYDFVMVDESQDSNPAFLAGMARQRGRQIYVGDEHQGIYGFRGAVNALATLTDCEERSLTLSHRFGPKVAALANAVIARKGRAIQVRPSPFATDTHVVVGGAPFGVAPLYLSRTNAGLFEQALALAQQGKSFQMMGGAAKLSFPDLADLLALARGQAKVGQYGAYRDLEELAEAAQTQGKPDLALRARLARRHGEDLPRMLSAINHKALPLAADPMERSLSPKLSTLHQAKGLESDWVELLDDFPPPEKGTEELTKEQAEEANILYVALTRARRGLAIHSPALGAWAESILNKSGPDREQDENIFG